MKRYSKKTDYNGKWVLCKDYQSFTTYESIFVIAIVDDIIKYVSESNPKHVMYSNISHFEKYYEFFVNPIQMANPLFEESKESNHPSIGRFEATDIEDIFPDNSSFKKDDRTWYCDKDIYYGSDCKNPYGSLKNENAPRCFCQKTSKEGCQHCKNGYCTASVLTSLPPQYQRCAFVQNGPLYKYCYEVN